MWNLLKLWSLFNNKKTSIGAVLMLAAMVLQQATDIWAGTVSPEWMLKLIETLQWLGGLFGGVGLGHKTVKTMRERRKK
ncbi:MAG: hypothetical protein P9L94_12535 [Candidatus Hinthialibacter antarcticus]|nr:hypothetical protein [Candidatus Hinthialibacter antarcticus]